MNVEIANDINSLDSVLGGVYIYGARTIAGRLFHYFFSKGIEVRGFLVSKKFENPTKFWGMPVYFIEDFAEKRIDCIILAVGHMFIGECVEKLSLYKIQRLIVVSNILDKKLSGSFLLNNKNVHISNHAMIASETIVYADETSEVHIEVYTCISGGDIIALNNSRINIGKSLLAENTHMAAVGNSNITLGDRVLVGHGTYMDAVEGTSIDIGSRTNIGYNVEIGRKRRIGRIKIGEGCFIGHDSSLGGNLFIDDASGFGEFSALSSAVIGKECMFSTFIRFIGNHTMLDENGNDITKRGVHIIGDHVWAGMGATFMPGCHVGSGAIVGTSAMVMGEIPEGAVCVGVPARVIRKNIQWKQ